MPIRYDPRTLEPLDMTAPVDWGDYALYLDAQNNAPAPAMEYEGWRDARAGILDVQLSRTWTPDGTPDTDSEVRFSLDGVYRYYLRRVWDPTKIVVVFVMLNPSTADAFQNDPTVTRVIDFAKRMGAGGVIVLNLFALRTPYPKELLTFKGDPIGPENDRIIVEETRCTRVVFAWGNHGAYLGRDRAVIDLLKDRNPECLHLTKDGCPGHPLYLSADRSPTPFRSPRSPQDVNGGSGSSATVARRKPWRRRP